MIKGGEKKEREKIRYGGDRERERREKRGGTLTLEGKRENRAKRRERENKIRRRWGEIRKRGERRGEKD